MTIRKNTNPIPLDLPVGLQDILVRNGMRAHITGSSNGFSLTVQGHDSPILTYPISKKQLMVYPGISMPGESDFLDGLPDSRKDSTYGVSEGICTIPVLLWCRNVLMDA